jgi:hypothetical protein
MTPRRAAAIPRTLLAACCAFAVSWGPHAVRAQSDAAAGRIAAFTISELDAARHASTEGAVAVDVLDLQSHGARNPDGVTLAAGDTLYVLGWAFIAPSNAACDAIGLLVEGNIYPGAYGFARPDVAASFKDPARTNVGYSIAVPAALLGAGSHAANVICVGPQGAARRTAQALAVAVR